MNNCCPRCKDEPARLQDGASTTCPCHTTPDIWEEKIEDFANSNEFVPIFSQIRLLLANERMYTSTDKAQITKEKRRSGIVRKIVAETMILLSQKTQRDIERLQQLRRGFDPGDTSGTSVAHDSGYDHAISEAILALKETK